MSKFLFYSSLLFSLFALQSFSYAAYADGDGSPEFPYEIAEPNQLIYMSQHPEHWGLNFILTADINLALADPNTFTTALIAPDMDSETSGFQGTPFTGVFDGNGHTISNLTIVDPNTGNDYLGLFGQIEGYDEKIYDLDMENISVIGGEDSSYLGCLCGRNKLGIIRNCYANGLVTGSSSLGGLVGFNRDGCISNCYANSTVKGRDDSSSFGGLVGYNYKGCISNCYATGSVTGAYNSVCLGGLCGCSVMGSINDCYSSSSVTGGSELGGLCGDSKNYGIISNCFFLDTAGPDNGLGTPLTDYEMKQQASFIGWDFLRIWFIIEDQGYPHLQDRRVPTYPGSGTVEDPFQISTAQQLNDLGRFPPHWDKHFILTADIDLAGLPYTTAVIAPDISLLNYFQGKAFSGIFDGNGHTIFNLFIDDGGNGKDYFGLFGKIDDFNAEIKNLSIENVIITSNGNNSDYLSGLCGWNGGRIKNCYSSVVVTGGGYSSYLGGLCGWNEYGILSNCYTTGSVTGGYDSRALGGLCGWNERGIINNCNSITSVTGGIDSDYLGGFCGRSSLGSITNCFSTGLVVGDYNVGGFCGDKYRGSINNCYFLDTAGPNNGYGIPLTDSEMKQQSSFSGWDFVNESDNGTSSWWIINPGEYPSLFYFDPTFVPHEFFGQGTAQDTYSICDPNDLGAIWQQPDCHYQLHNDLDLTGITWSLAVIPDFSGVLDGKGYTISNLNISGGSYLGLIGISSSNSIILNLGLNNINIIGGENSQFLGGLCGSNNSNIDNCYSSGSVTGDGYLGVLCGTNEYGIISNCFTISSVTGGDGSRFLGGLCGGNDKGYISNCYTIGSVSGKVLSNHLGGLCGLNSFNSSISNCYATVDVIGQNGSSSLGGICGGNFSISTISNCYFSGSVTAGNDSYAIGGLCGGNSDFSSINNCYSTGSVTVGNNSYYIGGLCSDTYYGSIINCYSSCSIIGGDNSQSLGGLCGKNEEGSITNCYSSGSVTGDDYLGGLCGGNINGNISKSYSYGSVTGGEGSSYLGSLCGYCDGILNDCYFLNTAGPDNGLGTPLDDPNMRIQASFVNWDFVGEEDNGAEDHWQMCIDGYDYPRLAWQFSSPADFLHPGRVDNYDLFVFTHDWLTENSLCCDIAPTPNPDGIVNLFDYLKFSEYWLKEDE